MALTAICVATGCECGPAVLGDLPGNTDTDPSTSDDPSASSSADDGADTTTSTGDDPQKGEWFGIQVTVNKDVDILFVIDNSSSMGGVQADLTANVPAFLNVLEAEDVTANFRIAVTTTDVGNPWCSTTTPEAGAFVASTCIQRIGEFTTADDDVSASACTDVCQTAMLETLPTTTASDDSAQPRPWIENIEGITNLPVDVTTTQALQCLLPQGITGCEFISPLEAARLAIERARNPADPAYGFLRERALLAIVFVTDGDDCSSPFEQRAIFLPPEDCYDADGDGDATEDCTQVFWSDPEAAEPTPAVCWNAGVACEGAMPQLDGTTSFESCDAVDKGLDGDLTAPDAAVLVPVSSYVEFFAELSAEKQDFSASLIPLGILGLPVFSGLPIPFATSLDPDFQSEHGIGPACTGAERGRASTPSVRLREFVVDFYGSFFADHFASSCAADASPALEPIANTIRDQLEPACVPACVADLDPSTPALDFDCELRQSTPPESDPVVTAVPACLGEGEVPDGADVCWIPITDADEIDSACGANLEVRLVRRDGVPAPGGTLVEISCVWDELAGECPGV